MNTQGIKFRLLLNNINNKACVFRKAASKLINFWRRLEFTDTADVLVSTHRRE